MRSIFIRSSCKSISEIPKEILLSSEYQFSELSRIIGEDPLEQSITSDGLDFQQNDQYFSDNPIDLPNGIEVNGLDSSPVADITKNAVLNDYYLPLNKNSEAFLQRVTA